MEVRMVRIQKSSLCAIAALAVLAGVAALCVRAQSESELAPETVLSTYHVQSGHEAEFQTLLGKVWQTYRKEQLVDSEPHILVRAKDASGNTIFTEVFTWVSHYAPDHAPDSVKVLWRQMESLCKRPDGRSGIEGLEVEIITPKP
jgi:hypothetical protein